jgi:hypothetical protein
MWLASTSAEAYRWIAITLQNRGHQNQAVRTIVPIQAIRIHSLLIMPGGRNANPTGP